MKARKFKIDGREFVASEFACESAENWRKSFPAVYGHLPAAASKAFASRDFNKRIPA